MLYEGIRATDVPQASESDLSHNGTKLTAGSRYTMSGRTVPRREDFAGNDESRGVGPKVLEEIGETVEEHESILCGLGSGELIVTKAYRNNEKV